jgi:hypothetical protein
VWEEYRLFLEKKSLDLRTICFRFGQHVLYQLSTTIYLGHLWVAEAEHNIFFLEEVYKQTASCHFFHFLTVVNRLRSNSSEPFAYALAARTRLAFKQNQMAGDSPSNRFSARKYDILLCSGSLSYPAVHLLLRPWRGIRAILSSEDVQCSSFPAVYSLKFTKVIVSTLSSNQTSRPAQSARKTLAAAPAKGIVTSLECNPDQPHQLSPLGSVLG